MKEHFIKEINALKKHAIAQGGKVESCVQQAVQAISVMDLEAAKAIVAADSDIDSEEILIEEECLKLLALYQPVATDLRTVIAILKINVALERMADYAVHITKRMPILAQRIEGPQTEHIKFDEMSAKVVSLIKDTMQVIASFDVAAAYSIIERDDEIDTMHLNNVKLFSEYVKRDAQNACYYMQAQGVSRDLERIADLSGDICEHVIYLETGKIVRHSPSMS